MLYSPNPLIAGRVSDMSSMSCSLQQRSPNPLIAGRVSDDIPPSFCSDGSGPNPLIAGRVSDEKIDLQVLVLSKS